jgi:hypothetical protein
MRAIGLVGWMLLAGLPASLYGASVSVYTHRPDDKAAVSLTQDHFDVHADGIADNCAART